MAKKINRCSWANPKNALYLSYHDKEWGIPVKDSKHLFAMLCLEGQQAGLSWETVLNKRANYYKLFFQFDPVKCSKITDNQIEKFLENPAIIRNRLKVHSIRKNAIAYLAIENEVGSFAKYLWQFVNNKPIINNFKSLKELPAKTEISDAMSKDLKKRGFNFVGSTICYAFMQACGFVLDHTTDCYHYKTCLEKIKKFKGA